jgi:hypothetical protein
MTGAVVSTTVTLNVFGAEVLFEASFAVQETGVVAIEKVAPLEGEHKMVGAGSIRSVAVGVNVTTAPLGPVASRVIVAGTVSVGALRSLTTTLNVRGGELLFEASFAVQETGVVPMGYVSAEGPRLQMIAGDESTPFASTAVTVKE